MRQGKHSQGRHAVRHVGHNTVPVSAGREERAASFAAILLSLVWVFLLGGLVGWLYETFICGPLNGNGINLAHGGLGIPFLQIYGVGAILMELAFGLRRAQCNPVAQVLLCALLCTTIEWAGGLIVLKVFGVQTWDYRIPGWDFMASPDGLVCLRASLTFGVFGLLQLRFFSPAFWRIWRDDDIGAASGRTSNARRTMVVVLAILLAIVVLAMLNAYCLHLIDVGETFQ